MYLQHYSIHNTTHQHTINTPPLCSDHRPVPCFPSAARATSEPPSTPVANTTTSPASAAGDWGAESMFVLFLSVYLCVCVGVCVGQHLYPSFQSGTPPMITTLLIAHHGGKRRSELFIDPEKNTNLRTALLLPTTLWFGWDESRAEWLWTAPATQTQQPHQALVHCCLLVISTGGPQQM